jgi:3-oxoacyl-(acyl-carrier-protein) synthase III
MTAKIIGTGSYLPDYIITNDKLATIVDTSDEWISERTGIKERRISREGNSFMAVKAAKNACEDAGIDASEIDIIIVATTSGDNLFPSTACEVQEAIGANSAIAFDISAACSGFIFALSTVDAFFKAGIYKTGLIIGVDVLSRYVDWNDRSTCVLFGDAAGAAVVKSSDVGVLASDIGSDGTGREYLSCKVRSMVDPFNESETKNISGGHLKMDGQAVFKFAVKKVPESIKNVLKNAKLENDDIKYYVLHQANERIISSVAKRLELPIEKFPMNLSGYGNTSAATIPVLLDEINKRGDLQAGDKILMSGFGAGLTWGSIILVW